jgi:hypothetical protein
MYWQGICTNSLCSNPAKFLLTDAQPVTVAMFSCDCCKESFRFVLKLDGSFEFAPYKSNFDLGAEEPNSAAWDTRSQESVTR